MAAVKAGYQVFAASGVVNGAGKPITLYAVNIVSDSTAGSVSIYNDSTAALDPVITLNGTASKGVIFKFPAGMTFPIDCYISLDDAHTTSVTAIYTKL